MTRGGRVEGDGGEETRYLKAIGRDVELEEDRLDYDQGTRRLTLAGTGSRKASAAKHHGEELELAAHAVIKKRPGIKAGEIGPDVKDLGISFQRGEEMRAVARLIDRGLVVVVPGKQRAKHHYDAADAPSLPDFPSLPETSRGSLERLPTPPYGGSL